jgi:hypothetical protein
MTSLKRILEDHSISDDPGKGAVHVFFLDGPLLLKRLKIHSGLWDFPILG